MNNNSTFNIFPRINKQFLKVVTALILLLTGQLGSAQVSTYAFSESVSSYTSLTTPSTAYSAPWDDHVSGAAFNAPLGFTFSYDGINQTQCYISPNGFISFGIQPASNLTFPLSVATPFAGGGAISALGMDLISGTATDDIAYSTIGTAPNRTFVVQWTNARRKVAVGNFNFQIQLHETTNLVEIIYGVCAPADPISYNAQVGLRGVTNDFLQGDVINRFQTGANVSSKWLGKTVSGNANSNTVRTSDTEYPDNGLKYKFTPSIACSLPTGLPSNFIIGSTSVTASSFIGNSFISNAPFPTNYLILRSTINTPPTTADVPNRTYWAVNDVISAIYSVVSVSNSNSFTQTGLNENTSYFYWVIPYNSGCLGGPFYNLSNMITSSSSTCISAPLGAVASSITGNSFAASWNSVPGASDYQLDVSTNNTFTALLPSYSNLSTAGLISVSVVGLAPLTTYYFRVRALGINCNVNSAIVSVTTFCGSFPIPYFQNFDTTPVATTPTCFTIANNNSDGVAWQVQNSLASSAPNAIHLATNNPIDSDDFFYTPGLNLTAGISYRLRFRYNTNAGGLYSENLRVRLGIDPSESSANSTLIELPGLINTVYQTAIVDFIPAVSTVYYLGFQGYSFANQSKILIDDISVIVSPTCFEPNNLTVVSVGATSAVISWEAPSTAPSNGYQYYVSTSNVQPSGAVTPSGSVGAGILTANITGLSAATLYYVWVRGNCSASDKSVWSLVQSFSTDCSVPSYLTVVNGTLCGGGSTTLTATGTSGSTIEWFSDSGGIDLVGTGANFVTPTLTANTTYYAQSKVPGGLIAVGPISPTVQGGSLAIQQTPTFVRFAVSTSTSFQSLDIYPIASGQNGLITIKNNVNVVLGTYSYTTNVAGGTTPQTIPIILNLLNGNYILEFTTLPASGLLVNSDNTNYPYTSSIATIVDNAFDFSYFMYAYNWKFSNICRSLLTAVNAVVTAAPPFTLSQTTATICSGVSTSLVTVSGAASYNSFVWSPSIGVSGSIAAGFTFNPISTTTYSLNASQSSGSLCSSIATITINVNPSPSAITINPSTASLCQGQIQNLNASLAAAPPITIYQENFNGVSNNWTTTNLSTGGLTSNSAWTLHNSTYTYNSSDWSNVNLSSNDASRFYFTNSDSQGAGTTKTYLESPIINLAGYSSASLNFWHYLRWLPGDIANIEASIDSGSTWNKLTNFVNSGTPSSFANPTVSLNTLVGNPYVKLRFYFRSSWGYGWAIDNIAITGVLAIEVGWTPVTDLYFNAAATTPYIAGTPTAFVYAKPNTTTTYTGTALGANGCFTNNTSVLTVQPKPTLGLLASSQDVCANWAPNSLTLVGSVGTIVRWEYATDTAFTTALTTIANTTTTLTPAQIGSFAGIRYYRAVLQNGTCPAFYSNSVYVSFYATTWNGLTWSNGAPNATTKAVFAGAYSSTGDLQACSVEVLSGVVTFNTNHTLTVQNDVKVTGGSLTFENQSSLVQVNYLDNNGIAFVNTGNITYKRTTTPMFKFDYTYWSSPVSPQNLQSISPASPSSLFYWYNPAINNWQYINPASTTMVSGRGYICRAPVSFAVGFPGTPSEYTANFIGVPNNGLITVPVTGGASQFNLLGNPYASALSADAFLLDAANAATLSGTIYLWTHNTPINAALQYTGSDYAIYNYLGGVNTGPSSNPGLNNSVPNGKIASGQGFFIKGLSNGTATFKNTMRIGGNNNQFFRMTSPALATTTTSQLEKHRYWLNIANTEGAFKQALLGYVAQGTLGLDRLFDGEMVDVGNAITLYTLVDDVKLSIQGRPIPFDVLDTIPLGYKSTINSTYTISLFDFDGLFTDQKIYLEDKALNIIHDLKNGNYTFTTVIGTFDDRFVLRYTNETLGTSNPVFNENNVVIYKNEESHFVIKSGTFIMDEVKVFDVRGRLLLKQKNINATQTRFNEGITNQVLLVQIKTVDGVTITKKVVR